VASRRLSALRAVVFAFLPLSVCSAASAACPGAEEHSLPLPSSLPKSALLEFQKTLFDFLDHRTYDTMLHWCPDKGVRDTGPFKDGVYYGTHPAVRIFYSPKLIAWLEGDRLGPIPDGAMMVKEQYRPPAARYANLSPDEVTARFAADGKDWTIMIRDAKGSADGWYWSELFTGMSFDSYAPPFNVFNGGFGLYCTRCHGAAEKVGTFAALENIKGYPGTPITYDVDDSWKKAVAPVPSHAPSAPLSSAVTWIAPAAGSAKSTLPVTSQPSVGDFLRVYEPLAQAGHDIVRREGSRV